MSAEIPAAFWLPPLIVAAINTALTAILWLRRRSVPSFTLGLYLLSAGLWSLGYCLELRATTVSGKLFWAKVQYLGPSGISVAGLLFVCQYAGRALRRRTVILISAIPLITQVIVWTNEYHGLIWKQFWLNTASGFPLTGRTHGTWFWVFLVYGYALNFTSIYMLFWVLFRRQGIYRWQAAVMLVGCMVPFIGNFMHAFEVGPLHHLDLTIFGFSVTGLSMGWGLFRLHLPDIMPIAREVALEGMHDGVIVLDLQGAVVDVNRAAINILTRPGPALIGRPATVAFREYTELAAFCDRATETRTELSIPSHGTVRRFDVNCSALRRRSGPVGYLLVLRDITEREAAAERLRQLNDVLERRVQERTADLSRTIDELRGLQQQLSFSASHDSLTQLANRALFFDRLSQRRSRWLASPLPCFALMYVDVDRFKVYNDAHGHDLGDLVLKAVGARLRACFRETDTVARMGGDEFTVLVEEVSSPEAVLQMGHRCRDAFHTPLRIGHVEVPLTISVGIALSTETQGNVEETLRDADLAMYQAKRVGGDSVVLFGESMRANGLSSGSLEQDLRAGLSAGEFLVQYQPLVHLNSLQTVGFEALIRWRHPERGTLLPHEFLPLAKQAGLIAGIDEFVIQEACRQKARWERETAGWRSPPHLSINVTGWPFFQPQKWWSILSDSLSLNGTGAVGFRIEITEEELVHDRATAEFFEQVRRSGLYVYLDDFGTGYSSLSRLSRVPIRGLKVDRSFVQGMEASPRDLTITKAIIAMAHSLDLEVIAEGIESSSQSQLLRELGCDYGQGYYFSPPVDAEEASRFLSEFRD